MRTAPRATRSEVIAEVAALAASEVDDAVVEAIVWNYFADVPPADLEARPPSALLAALRHHVELGRRRRPGQTLVAVREGDGDGDGDGGGAQPPHSSVDIVTDDMPFLLDSVTAELERQGIGIHLVVHPIVRVARDAAGELAGVAALPGDGATDEAWVHLEIDRRSDPAALEACRRALERVLADVRAAVADWAPMRQRALDLADDISARLVPAGPDEAAEVAALLRWLAEGHMVMLGARDDDLVADGDALVRPVPGSGLGVLRDGHPGHEQDLPPPPPQGIRRRVREARLVRMGRAGARSTVFRPDELLSVAIARFDGAGRFVGEHRFVGLLTATAYRADAEEVPVIRRKIAAVLDRAGYPLHSHSGRELRTILGTYPRDELFSIDVDALDAIATGVLDLQERRQTRLFPRVDPDERFVSCLVYLPRDRYSTGAVERIEAVLVDAYGGVAVEHTSYMSESVLARLHVIVALAEGADPTDGAEPDVAAIEARLAAATRWWVDDLRDALVAERGEEQGLALLARYGDAFPAGYREATTADAAVADIARLDAARDDGITTAIDRGAEGAPDELRLKLVTTGQPVTLSRVLPLLEHMGVQVVDERPSHIRPHDGPEAWIYDIGLRVAVTGVGGVGGVGGLPADERVLEEFQRLFAATWRGAAESDGLNRLVLLAGLSAAQVVVVRAYARYLRQIGTTFTPAYVEDTLAAHPGIVRALAALFELRFDPARQAAGSEAVEAEAAALRAEITGLLDGVASLDEDRILRSLLHLVTATTRTNVYRPDRGRGAATVVALKFDPSLVPEMPLPRPMFEIWVHAAHVEGVHLRGGPVARGGLRWSDRREDVRTEVLGLMKAQMVKNAVIVPVGAKGGFVVRTPPADADELRATVRDAYRSFVAGLLDVTDNLVGGRIVPPRDVVRHDGDDPYLVVAADKGTATFSDLANETAAGYDFWLGDAFASGGSAGYDHKAMGITARGTWCSVQRHFRTLGIDADTAPITVVGIGDMSGDVFGNGMLLSRHLRLLAAFDHRHVFIDPDPDPAVSDAERRRLFDLPRSSWDDYDRALISPGGGVWPRTAKSMVLPEAARLALGIDAEALPPGELISAILRAPVDLLWNGGIGTYVKASDEHDGEVGDRANDAVRVDASSLRCRVVAEGGNLGVTQAGRVEFARAGGLINTDAIDNSAGVDCSDHEVNIKIALGDAMAAGELDASARRSLLVAMTDEVAELVLQDNREQNLALAMARAQAPGMIDVHARLIRGLERDGVFDRALEDLPTDKQLAERQAAGEGLTPPEIAVLLAYTKTTAVTQLLASDLPDDPWLEPELMAYFPAPLRERFPDAVRRHRLRREIVATAVVNEMVNVGGTSFVYRMATETGASVPDIARAHLVAARTYRLREQWDAVEALGDTIDATTEIELLLDLRRLVERATLWLLRRRRPPLDVGATIAAFAPGIERLATGVFERAEGREGEVVRARAARAIGAGVPVALAQRAAVWPLLHLGLDLVEVAAARGRDVLDVAAAQLDIVERLDLAWLRERIGALHRTDRWQSQARAALRDDLTAELRELTGEVVRSGDASTPPVELVERWVAHNARVIERLCEVYEEIRSGATFDLTTLSVALRQLRNLLLASTPALER